MNDTLLKENRQHGNPLYPVKLYDVTGSPEDLLYLHWHDEMEFLLLTRGKANFRVGLRDYELEAGEAIFVNSGLLHAGTVIGQEPCSFVAFVFHANLFGAGSVDFVYERYIHPLVRGHYEVPVHIRPTPGPGAELLGMLAQIEQANRERRLACEMETKGLLLACLSKLLAMGSLAEPSNQGYDGYQIERLKTVVDYMERHYADPIQLKQLADLARMSESYFCRFFKKMTDQSPFEFLNAYRLRRAAMLLKQTDGKIMDVALEVGFGSLSFFNTLFRQRFGCTPGQYRKTKPQNPLLG